MSRKSAKSSVVESSTSSTPVTSLRSDGDFSVRLPRNLVGVEGKIADAFNEIVAFSDRRAKETVRVSNLVGKEGKLKQRMNVQEGLGVWAEEVSAINILIDDLVWPTTEVTRAIGAVAK